MSHARQASATKRDATPRAQRAGLRGARPAAYIFWAAQNVRAVGQLPNPLPVLQALFDSWNVRVPAGIGVVAPVRSKAVLGEAGEQVRDGLKSSFAVVGGHVDACAACANQPFHVLLCDFSCQAVKSPSVCAPSHPWYLLLLCQSYSGKVVGQQLARARLRKQIFVCSAEMRTQTRRGIATCHSRSVDVRSSAVVALASPVRVSNWVGKGLLSSTSDNLGWHSAHWEIRSPKCDRRLARRILAIWEAAGGGPSRLRLGFESVPNPNLLSCASGDEVPLSIPDQDRSKTWIPPNPKIPRSRRPRRRLRPRSLGLPQLLHGSRPSRSCPPARDMRAAECLHTHVSHDREGWLLTED